MAKQSIANPVVSLGLDSSGLRSGIASSMGDVKSAGSKIGAALKNSISPSTIFSGFGKSFRNLGTALVSSTQYQWEKVESGKEEKKTKAGILTEINSGLSLANKVKNILAGPVNALMGREAFLAEQNGMPLLTSSDAGYSGVFARLLSQWEDLLADMMVALDKALDFRSMIEYVRGMMVGVKVLLQAMFGPLDEVKKDPQALAKSVKAGAELTIDLFGNVAKISVQIYNSFVDIVKLIQNIPGLGKQFNKDEEDKIEKWLNDPRNQVFVPDQGLLGGRPGGQAIGIQVPAGNWVRRGRDEAIKALGLNDNGLVKMGLDGIEKIIADARANLNRMFVNNPLAAPKKDRAKDAATVAGVLIPIMERMAQSRLSTALTSDSTALVEAVTRASVTGPGQDLQQRVALAAEENVRIAQATKTIQEKILNAYENSPTFKNAQPEFKLV